jgi:hypothetical protein
MAARSFYGLADRRTWGGAVAGLALCCLLAAAAGGADELAEQFASPPPEVRPWVYWFPLHGNITREGITADLEAMARVGIGGVLYMEVDQGAPPGAARFAGPLWRELFQHACAEAARLGLEVNMNNDAGWCGSGGPWITPQLAMQKVVWSETDLSGPLRFEGLLAPPKPVGDYYRDIAVLAFPTPAGKARIENIKGKSALTPLRVSLDAPATWSSVAPDEAVARHRIVDLTATMAGDGTLSWEVPAGKWTVLRLGHTPTGKDNHPSPPDGRGPECDKLSKEAAEAHFNALLGKLIADVGPLAGKTLVSTHIDSWEVGSQNWTPRMRQEFQRRRGYDLRPLLPVLTGRVVHSVEVSERFLWDLRQTISELLLENYAGHFRDLAHRHGLRLSIEAYHTCPCDEMAYAGRADEPMGEFWSWNKFSAAYSCTEMASAAHVYGKRIVGAEAFTATNAEKWLGHPGGIKDLGDWAFCEGINRFVFHRYALQPWVDRRPGMSMGPWGLHYERTQTWWEQSKAWHEYLARCQFLLRQGLFVADICLLGPEGSPQSLSGQRAFLSKTPGQAGQPLDRPGYNFDTCPPEVVLTRMSVQDGRLLLPDGMSYRVLVLPRSQTMTPRLLRKIQDLVEAGATVMGLRPAKSPSLSDYPDCDAEVNRLAAALWGEGETPAELSERLCGKGRVIWGSELAGQRDREAQDRPRLSAAKWIWRKEGNPARSAPPGKRYFRRVLTVEAASPIESATLVMTADNSFQCWINGRRAGSGDRFTQTYEMNITSLLKPGPNLVAVEATNATDKPNPAGLIGAVKVKYRNGRMLELGTDRTWQADEQVTDGWTSDAASPGQWAAALELGPLGMPPWGDVAQALAAPDVFPDVDAIGRWLAKTGLPPDFSCRTRSSTQSLRYIHRAIGETDVYFVAHKNPEPEEAICSFRVGGKRPELWWPDTGRIQRPAAYDEADGCVRVPIRFGPSGSVFVVFRRSAPVQAERIVSVSRDGQPLLQTAWQPPPGPPAGDNLPAIDLVRNPQGACEAVVAQPGRYELKTASGRLLRCEVPLLPPVQEVGGPWELSFPPNWGAPQRIMLDKLISWSEHSDPGVKYFSGTATYRKALQLSPESLRSGRRLYLDLGRVEVMVEVQLNGHDLGILWKRPFRIDVTDALRPGENVLELKVVNLWVNRMIGDEQLPEDSDRNPNGTLKQWPQWLQEAKASPTGRYTFTSWRLWKQDDPLQPSGLLGPVRLLTVQCAVVP